MARIAFFGLGVMGRPMAKHLLSAGHSVVAHRHRGNDDLEFRESGGELASTIDGAAASADVAITVLPDSPEVRSVALGSHGILANLAPDSLYVDMSTVAPSTSRELAAVGATRAVRVLDAPVSGGEAGAVSGILSIMVGGRQRDFEEARPLLESMGSIVRHVGDHGAGQTVKAANQLIVAGQIQLLAEAIVFLEKSGVEPGLALEVIGGGLAGSTVLDRRGKAMLGRQFAPGFRVDLHHKDLGILSDAARSVGAALPLAATVTQLMAALRALGGGSLDHTGMLALNELLNGRPPGAEIGPMPATSALDPQLRLH